MKVLVSITPVYRRCLDRWLLPSLQLLGMEDLVIETDTSPEAAGNGNFRTPEFDQHILNKFEWIASHADSESEPFLVTDADIIYFRPFVKIALRTLGDNDLALAREYPGRPDHYNIGQMVVRPSAAVAAFFRSLAEELGKPGAREAFAPRQAANQDHLNTKLRKSGLRHTALPSLFANAAVYRSLKLEEFRHLISYHATGTYPQPGMTSLERKDRALAEVAGHCGWPWQGVIHPVRTNAAVASHGSITASSPTVPQTTRSAAEP